MANSECLLSGPTELRIVLIGRVGAGKTAVMNTILRGTEENEETASQTQISFLSNTATCQKETVHIGKQNIIIVDTPGLCHAEKTNEEVIGEIKRGLSLADPGPHVLLFVLDLQPFAQEEQDMVKMIWTTFGENAAQHAVALFTHGNELKKNETTIKEFIQSSTALSEFVSKCSGGHHVIENNSQDPHPQVAELLKLINNMVKKNGEKVYKKPTEKGLGIKKKIALSVNGSALGGAGVGAAATYLSGSTLAVPIGAGVGAAVGGVLGGVGIVVMEHVKAKTCVIQ